MATFLPSWLKLLKNGVKNMIEAAAEASEELMDKYLGGDELTEEEIIGGLRQRTLAGEIQPMLCGSAFKTKVFNVCWTQL